MTPLKLLIPEIVMVKVLPSLTKNITDLRATGNPFKTLEILLIRSLRDLIRNQISLKRKSLEPNQKPRLITKKPHVTNVERKAILQNISE